MLKKTQVISIFLLGIVMVFGFTGCDILELEENENVESEILGAGEGVDSDTVSDWEDDREADELKRTLYVESNKEKYAPHDPITLRVYNRLDETVSFRNSALGLEVEKKVNGNWEKYNVEIIALDVIVDLKSGETAGLNIQDDLITKPGEYRLSVNGVMGGFETGTEVYGKTEIEITEEEQEEIELNILGDSDDESLKEDEISEEWWEEHQAEQDIPQDLYVESDQKEYNPKETIIIRVLNILDEKVSFSDTGLGLMVERKVNDGNWKKVDIALPVLYKIVALESNETAELIIKKNILTEPGIYRLSVHGLKGGYSNTDEFDDYEEDNDNIVSGYTEIKIVN